MDKLSEFNNGVKYLLICVDVFSRLVRVQSMKSKYAPDAVAAFKKMLRKNTKPDRVWVDQGTEFGREFKKFCKSRDIKIYSTRSETKAAIAGRAIRSLKNTLKNIIYRYMEENGDKYVHKMYSFVNTMNTRNTRTRVNRSIGKSPKNIKNSDFLSVFYKNPIFEYKKPRFKIGDKVRISKYDVPFRKGYKSQFTSEIFQNVKIATLKLPTYNLHKPYAKRTNEIWCLDLAFMDKLSEFNNGVKYLLICVDVFSRLVRVQSMKSKYAPDAVAAFKKMLRKNTKPDRVWVDQGTEFGREFKKFCKSRDIKIYSTRSETKAAIAGRAIRSLKNTLKNIIYRYMEENGDKYVHKMDSFVNTMNTRNTRTRVNRSIGKSPKNIKNSDFLSVFYKNPIFEYKKPRFKIGDKVRISKYDVPFRKGYKSQFTSEIFQNVKIATLKLPTYNLHGEQGDEILGKFYEQELAKCII